MARDNRSLGRFHLDGIMPAPRGVPQIEVTIDIDANSIMSVTAKDKATGKENKIRIEGGSQLSKEDIERMKKDAEANAEADRKEREKIDKLNQTDSLIFQTEKQMKEFDEKFTQEDKENLTRSLDALKQAHKSADMQNIDECVKSLNDEWAKVSTKLYEQTKSDAPIDPENKDKGGEDVEDVAFEEVK
jgi:molecular chaperone DnaK